MVFTLKPFELPDTYGESVVPLATVKAQLRVLHDDEDDLIGILRDAAISLVEHEYNVLLLLQTGREAVFEDFGPVMRLGIEPCSTVEITDIDYVDADGAAASLATGDWRVLPDGSIVPAYGTAWPSGQGQVVVTYNAGYPEGACPKALVQAVLLFTGHLYRNREAVVTGTIATEIPLGFAALCEPFGARVI